MAFDGSSKYLKNKETREVFEKWRQQILSQVQERIATLTPHAGTWASPLRFEGDNGIPKEVSAFLCSPTEQTFSLKKGQSERCNLEQALPRTLLDFTYETISKGSPHTLQVTKNAKDKAHFEQELAKLQEAALLLTQSCKV